MKMYHIQLQSKISPWEKQRDMFKAFAMLLCSFLHIFNFEYPKMLEATILLIQKLFLRISDNICSKRLQCVHVFLFYAQF